jgi:hypothetical protein
VSKVEVTPIAVPQRDGSTKPGVADTEPKKVADREPKKIADTDPKVKDTEPKVKDTEPKKN